MSDTDQFIYGGRITVIRKLDILQENICKGKMCKRSLQNNVKNLRQDLSRIGKSKLNSKCKT